MSKFHQTSCPKRKCKKCSYVWHYSGSREYFCCPNCMTSSKHPLVE